MHDVLEYEEGWYGCRGSIIDRRVWCVKGVQVPVTRMK